MDTRKLIQHGYSSLSLVMPQKWIKEHGLKKGDSVFVKKEGSKIIINTTQSKKIKKKSINLTDLDRTSFLLYIQSLYRYGFNEIEIQFDNETLPHFRTKKEVSSQSLIYYVIERLIGAEIIEQTKNKVVIKQITKDSGEDFRVTLRRALLLIKETSATLFEGIKTKDTHLIAVIENRHDNITKFVSYSLRLLNKYGYPDVKKTSLYFHIIASLDKIADIMKYVARDLPTDMIRDGKTIKIVEKIHESIELYYAFFYNFSTDTANKLNQNRELVKSGIKRIRSKVPVSDLVHILNLKQILEVLLDLTEFRMGLEN